MNNIKKVIEFAFIPKIIDGKFIWFKKYVAIYEYKWTSWKEYYTSGLLLQNQTEVTKCGYKWIIINKKRES